MILNVAIVLVVVVLALLLWSPRLYASVTWRAMTTPLASLIGSGFLVLGPLLDAAYGKYAPVIMALLCLFAYFYGAAIRYNMRVIERPGEKRSPLVGGLETAASWSLGFAYIISVAYYLNLFGAFGVSLTAINEPLPAKIVTSAVYVIIVVAGWRRGFKSLEQMEYISVTAKLAIIAGLLLGLAVYFYGKATDGGLIFNAPDLGGWPALTLAFGLIVTVQGFETSRYLSADYDSHTRIRSMQWAQWLSTVIYMLYILLLAFVFERGALQFSETAIVDMMAIVAPILPVLLVGLVAELTGERVSARMAYVLLTGIGLALTWSAGIFDIISYASRAFAAYYGLQAFIAMLNAWRQDDRWHSLAFAALTLLAVLIVLFGQAVEQ